MKLAHLMRKKKKKSRKNSASNLPFGSSQIAVHNEPVRTIFSQMNISQWSTWTVGAQIGVKLGFITFPSYWKIW